MATKGVNKVILVGNLGNDPEVRYMPNGNAVANLSLATSESWKDQQGQVQERTEWHRLTMYRRLAEIAGEYLKKGSQIYVEGKLQVVAVVKVAAVTVVTNVLKTTKVVTIKLQRRAAITKRHSKVVVSRAATIKRLRVAIKVSQRTHQWLSQILTSTMTFRFKKKLFTC